MFLFKSKSKKSGPLKAISTYFSEDASEKKGSTKQQRGEGKGHGKSKGKSKDDSSMGISNRGKVQANPYATIKMWRPLDMQSSATEDEDVYQSFTNFDSLRELAESSRSSQQQQQQRASPGGGAGAREGAGTYSSSSGGDLSHRSSASEPITSRRESGSHGDERNSAGFARVPLRKAPPRPTGPVQVYSGSPQTKRPDSSSEVYCGSSSRERSYSGMNGSSDAPAAGQNARLKKSAEIVSESAADAVHTVTATSYDKEEFDQATRDIEILMSELKSTLETLRGGTGVQQERGGGEAAFAGCKAELYTQTKQLINEAKQFVSSATQSREKLSASLTGAMHALATTLLHAQAAMTLMAEVHGAQHLGFEVIKVTNAFKSTISAAHAAVGKPLSDPHMKYLMRQAQNLASLLNSLLRTVKAAENH